MAAYRLTSGSTVIRESDGAFIPDDPGNRDWQTYQAWLKAGNTADPVPSATLAQQAAVMLAAGLAVTSTGTPALDGTYAADPQTQSDLMAEVLSLAVNSAFTNGTASLGWPDIYGAYHTFNATQFKALATALGAFAGALKPIIASNSGTLPSASVTIP